jgi:hypothetical protein
MTPIAQQVEDPIVEALRQVAEDSLGMYFLYANTNEANFGLDHIDDDPDCHWPVFLFVSDDKSENRLDERGVVIRTAQVNLMLLNTLEEPTDDFTSERAAPYIYALEEAAYRLIRSLNDLPATATTENDIAGGIVEWQTEKVYGKFDRHLFGVALTFKWPYYTGKLGC